jgi:hypothetical protein
MFWREPDFKIKTLSPGTKPEATPAAPAAGETFGRSFGETRHAEFKAAETTLQERERVAYIVIHGMGQQVEYETLGQLGDLMADEERKLGKYSAPIDVQVVRTKITNDPNDGPLSRAELSVKRVRNGVEKQIDVHVYEGYWAPLTEGQISFLETVSFLFSAAFNGIKSSVRGSAFKRWMFGGFQKMQIKKGTFYSLLTLSILLVAVFSPLGLAYYFWQQIQSKGFHWSVISGHPIISAVLLVALAIYCWLIYYVTVEYVGDVAIYVSSYKVSRFEEVRGKIQDAVFNVVRQVYSARDDADQARPLYNKVVIVGHSLGTVIAYDMLNAAISWDQAEKNNSMDVVGRTSALITFGSPLDKTAFLFRTQVSGPKFLREALAAQRQPLIMNYKEYRPLDTFHWTNIYSRMDIVSGCLMYYDTPEESAPVTAAKKTEMEAAPKKPDADTTPEQFRNPVINVVDPAAWIPLLAHVQYWNDQKLRDELYGAIR